jgi:hypothetical protein
MSCRGRKALAPAFKLHQPVLPLDATQVRRILRRLKGRFMPQAMPKGTKCTGCSLPIKIEESFVGYRFGVGVQFWHNRSRIHEDCWGRFLLERVHEDGLSTFELSPDELPDTPVQLDIDLGTFCGAANVSSTPMNRRAAIEVTDWMVTHGQLPRWTCAYITGLL